MVIIEIKMIIGISKLELYLLDKPGSLKEKRQILRRLKDRIKNKFDVNIAEVEDLDLWQKAIIGVACISNGKTHANQIISKVINFIEQDCTVEIMDKYVELINV